MSQNEQDSDFEGLWKYFFLFTMDLTSTEIMLWMEGGIFLRWMIIETGGLDRVLGEIEAMTKLYQTFSTTALTGVQQRVNILIHQSFQ